MAGAGGAASRIGAGAEALLLSVLELLAVRCSAEALHHTDKRSEMRILAGRGRNMYSPGLKES